MTFTYAYGANRPKKNNDDDVLDDDDKQGLSMLVPKKPYKQYVQAFAAQHLHFYICEPVGHPPEYTDMIYQIASAGPSDVVYIHLNTPGGVLDTGVQLINAMQNSQAKIVTILEGSAYSLGTLIFLAGDEMVVHDNCMMMIHNFNGGLVGKGNELVSELEATIKWFAALAKNIYVPFLTEEELARVIKGEDMWMQSPEIRERLVNMSTILAEEAAAEEAAIEKALEELERELEAPKPKPRAKPKAKAKAPAKKRGRPAKVVDDVDSE